MVIQAPVSGEIIQGFGGNAALYARFGLRGHNGLDYACPIGTPVFAAASGTVTKIQTEPDGYGLHVRLTHAWGRTIYAHLSEVNCRLGQVVPAGALIARSGSSGFSDCPHLHFEVRQTGLEGNGFNGALDPLPLLTPALAEPPTLSGVEARPEPVAAPPVVPTVAEPAEASVVSPPLSVPDGGGREGVSLSLEGEGRGGGKTVRVIVPYINIRTGPTIAAPLVGMFYTDRDLPYDRIIPQGSNLWMQFGSLFAAAFYAGEYYVSGLPLSQEGVDSLSLKGEGRGGGQEEVP